RHSISEASASNFVGVAVPNVYVEKIDNEAGGVVITQTGDGTTVFENGNGDSFTVGLSHAPAAGETVTVTLSGDGRLNFSSSTLQFTSANWQQGISVGVRAPDDSIVQGFAISSVHYAVTSTFKPATPANFDHVTVPDLDVLVADNDSAGVLIQETGGSTRLIEAGSGVPALYANSAPFSDTYTIVLPKAPTASVTINVQPQITETGGTIKKTFSNVVAQTSFDLGETPRGGLVTRVLINGNRLDRSQFTVVNNILTINAPIPVGSSVEATFQGEHADKQVLVSTDNVHFFSPSAPVVFTTANWNVAQTVYVRAIDNDVVDGDAIQAFAQQTRTLDAIQGPLTIEGGNDPNADTTIPPPVMYIAETDPHEFVPDPNPNFPMLEPEPVDVLSLLNTDSVADGLGTLTDTQLTGFGMHTGRMIAGKAYPAGVVYSDIELLRVDTGNGNDRLRIDS